MRAIVFAVWTALCGVSILVMVVLPRMGDCVEPNGQIGTACHANDPSLGLSIGVGVAIWLLVTITIATLGRR